MKVLVACEFSGVVREAFRKRGHDAWSCDLLPTETPGQHIQDDVKNVLRHDLQPFNQEWDLVIAHPPCTHLAVSGARYFKQKQADGRQQDAIRFFEFFTLLATRKVCIENPICIMSRIYRKPDQIIQPYMFGHEATKATCLWLKNLPPLMATSIVGKGEFVTYASGKRSTLWHAKTGGGSGHKRSITFQGIANAMAEQWS